MIGALAVDSLELEVVSVLHFELVYLSGGRLLSHCIVLEVEGNGESGISVGQQM